MSVEGLQEDVQSAVLREREVVAGQLAGLRAQSERLRAVLAGLDHQIDVNARLLRQMDELAGLAPQMSIDAIHGELRGRRLQEIAVELLRREKGDGVAVHYKDWFGLLLDAGLQVGGKEPLATFLTQISRAPGVESVKPRSGLFRLRAA